MPIYTLPKNTRLAKLRLKGNVQEVDCTSHAKYWAQGLSPFRLGPCKLKDGRTAKNMENAWQYSKVYADHLGRYDNVKKDWVEWSKNGFNSRFAERYPMGKGAIPKFSLYGNERLDYVRAKQLIYYPLYAKAVRKTEAYSRLVELYETCDILVIRDFDAFNRRELNMTLMDVATASHKRSGHGFVLEMMLTWGPDFYKIFR